MCRGLLIAILLGWAGVASAQTTEGLEQHENSLASLVREALERNPEVLRAGERVRAMRARVPQAGALPDPTLASGVINEGRAVPFDTLGEDPASFSEVYVGITQDFPFPGKRGLREEVAREEAEAEVWAYEIARRRLAVAVAQAYHELHAVQTGLEVLDRNVELMDQLVQLTRGRFAVGQGVQQDVLEAEVERSRLEERRSLLDQERRTLEAAVARLLDRDAPVRLGRVERVVPTPLPGTLEDLLAQAEEASPLLYEERDRVDAAGRRLKLARRDLLPDLGLELVYHYRGQRDFDPFYTLGWTVTLPVYASRKQQKAIEEAAAELGAARSTSRATRAEIRYAVSDAYFKATTARRLLRLYDEGLLRQDRLALDSATAQYEVGKVDFPTVLASWRRLLDDEIAYHLQMAAHEKALAQLALHLGSSAAAPF